MHKKSVVGWDSKYLAGAPVAYSYVAKKDEFVFLTTIQTTIKRTNAGKIMVFFPIFLPL